MDIGIAIAIALFLGAVGFFVGRSAGRAGARSAGVAEGRAEADTRIRAAAEAISRGRMPEGAARGSAESELFDALERGWSPRETERMAALREAVGRVSGFLTTRVRAPLADAAGGVPDGPVRDGVQDALGALEDLDFFLTEVPEEREGADLVPLVKQVAHEFAGDHSVGIRMQMGTPAVRASVNPNVLLDSLYLILHNAERFGGGGTIDVTLDHVDGRARVTVRDRGPGFTEEAFKRAFDPFYSTSAGGLGLGLPHARGLVEGMGGRVELRNAPDGGAEVEVSFPSL